MNYLLDTHSLLWFLSGASELSNRARRIIESPDHEILVSVASLWEIAIKHNLGKLGLDKPFGEMFPQQLTINSFRTLAIGVSHCEKITELPFHHRDPFDRLLVAQGLTENLPIVSCDEELDAYGVERLW